MKVIKVRDDELGLFVRKYKKKFPRLWNECVQECNNNYILAVFRFADRLEEYGIRVYRVRGEDPGCGMGRDR